MSAVSISEQQDDSDISCFQKGVKFVVQASPYMNEQIDEKYRCSIGMQISDDSIIVYVSADVGYGGKDSYRDQCTVHSQE